jgi:Domain of unknown function (DUF4351)
MAEIAALPPDYPYRQGLWDLLVSYRIELSANQTTEPEEQELLMQLSPLYLEQLETARSEGEAQGEARGEARGELKGRQELVLRLLNRQIPGSAAAVEATIRTLSAAQLDTFGEALLGFQSADDLRAWLAENA